MSTIDWSKAPVGATHATSGSGGGTFYRNHDDRWELWSGDSWVFSIDWADWSVTPGCFIASPSPWTGEGLPPVGTVCEINMKASADRHAVDVERYQSHIGEEVEIVAHHDIGGGCSAAVYAIRNGFAFEYHSLVEGNFRPIRTPEQIAAQARTEAIDDMVKALGMDSAGTAEYIRCGLIYDAGYRKQVMK